MAKLQLGLRDLLEQPSTLSGLGWQNTVLSRRSSKAIIELAGFDKLLSFDRQLSFQVSQLGYCSEAQNE